MGRWQPDARGRLEKAAMELYGERGFDQTTVAEIAERAGLTERTFFRHFADKREVLFAGSEHMKQFLETTLAELPAGLSPIDATGEAFAAAGALMQQRRDLSLQRQQIIIANPDLQERELIKLAAWTVALTRVLRERGVADPAAGLAAQAGTAVFRTAFEAWITEPGDADLPQLVRQSLEQLKDVTAGR
ncbi:TetR family transcriptional regulator [Actinoplanes friuliensis]|uniref:Regulatory protein TetR n=1 Tax=Actinoplanes friuliensis DSM 7358 TaxID=1246995 RepID=U5W280_9ACTN|nr:TetR family transcriptional regulator [Actinoplanes friuliensis]AGZ43112.1 regulatory protein TetR [Actinoplanes friuliensis DSM 7358]